MMFSGIKGGMFFVCCLCVCVCVCVRVRVCVRVFINYTGAEAALAWLTILYRADM